MNRPEPNPDGDLSAQRRESADRRRSQVDPPWRALDPRPAPIQTRASAPDCASPGISGREEPHPPRVATAPSRSRCHPILDAPASADPNHHLWRNGRFWWVAFTVHLPGWRKERIRRSLETADLGEARRRRDAIIERIAEIDGTRPSLRYAERRVETDAPRNRAGLPLPEPADPEPLRSAGPMQTGSKVTRIEERRSL